MKSQREDFVFKFNDMGRELDIQGMKEGCGLLLK